MPIVGDITLSQEQMTISAAGGEFSVNITTEYDYKAISNIDWVEVTRVSYSANYSTLYFSVAQNDTTSSRAGVLTIFCDDYNLSAKLNILQKTREQIPNNEIWYTSSNRAIVVPSLADDFGANIISNTYNDGKGVITFDGDVPYIGFEAFRECTTLKSIVIPNSATAIGQYAFYGCTSLTSATLPDGVTTIGYGAFSSCVGLKSVVIPDSVTCIEYRAFQLCTSLGNITIPNSVTEIGDYAFGGCSSLTSITIPSSITSIREGSFASCDRLSSIIIPDSVTEIGDSAFIGCKSLTSVRIGNSVTSIGYEAFYGCTSLTSVTIPNSVTSIGDYAFYYCPSLTEVYCKPTTPPTRGYHMFEGNASERKIYVPRNSVEAYKAAKHWSDYANYIVGHDF